MKISVIIPVLNEAARLNELLKASLFRDDNIEVIVVDGGSVDLSGAVAIGYGATVIDDSLRGRGQQLAAGATQATGDVLLFLHADTVLPPNGCFQIRQALREHPIIGGNFELEFDGDTGFARWLTRFYAWLRRRGLYYGDSAIFIRRTDFQRIGGIRAISLMEDYDLVRRMERAGATVNLGKPGAITSSRRFAGRKPWRIFWQWCYLHALFHIGISPDWLARLYKSERHAD